MEEHKTSSKPHICTAQAERPYESTAEKSQTTCVRRVGKFITDSAIGRKAEKNNEAQSKDDVF